MPKITSHKYKGYEVTVSYSLKQTCFEIILPEDLANYGSYKGKIIAETQQKVEDLFDKIVNQYIKEGAERKKFIAIRAETDRRCEDDFMRAKGSEGYLLLQYAIVTKVTIAGKEHYKYSSAPLTVFNREQDFYEHGDVVFIEWTQEREDFLSKTIKAIGEIAQNVKKFVDSDNVAALLDAKKPMLLVEDKSKGVSK